MNPLIVDLLKNEKYANLLNHINLDSGKITIEGIGDAQKAHLVYSLTKYGEKSSLIVCNNTISARKMIQDLKFFSDFEIIYFPAREIIYYDMQAQSREIQNQRIYAIDKVVNTNTKKIVVATIDSLLQKMMPKETFKGLSFVLKKDIEISINELTEKLDRLGYVRSQLVEGKGEFTIRGGIIDLFPPDDNFAYRIEFFGDTIDSIRKFDTQSQRSIENVDEIKITYASEFLIQNDVVDKTIQKLNNLCNEANISNELKQQINEDILKLEQANIDVIIDKYFELLVPDSQNLLDYLNGYNVYIDEPVRCMQKSKNVAYENVETLKMLAEKNYLYIPYALSYITYENFQLNLKRSTSIYLEKLTVDASINESRKKYTFNSKEYNFYQGSQEILMHDILRWQEENKYILLIFPSKSKALLIYNQLIDNGIKNVVNLEELNVLNKFVASHVYVTSGMLSGGFIYDDFNLCVVAQPVSGIDFLNKKKKIKNKISIGQDINTFDDLSEGNYVVHENHGIGIYRGIHTVTVGNIKNDYIKIEYDSGSILYVPITQLDSVKKYVCDDDTKPKLNLLGSNKWHKTKSKAKEYVETIAKDLVLLYAKRKHTRGYGFSKDTPWQKEFEDTFKYELTDDQKQALDEVKHDMEQEVPMDRLLCGDVGYGKTEVAIRAAFKSVMDSKQVAYLVPTTVLCMQQYRTFKERMEPFGIKVEMLSRFKTPTEQKNILKDLKNGNIDVVIGTHRILSKDVLFKDLGFLIIDEEHRFGVKAKETIKKLKETIDVLSMTATPIPRTLHMSMIGVRQMSTLTVPPLERMPVHTYVLEYDSETIKEAIDKELSRDGQVFYISNRVENIEHIAQKVQDLAPQAKVEYAHGQMEPNQIEDIMLRFISHQSDIIVCTTILESGIDIQNANTIIIENSDKLGLAQLYQIRGRVGRSSRLAYAYITYPKDKQISEVAEKRLKAIKDFTEFGSGFKIALRDLEIRGAGNLFGSRQHGHMASVGYEMYISMLEKAIKEQKQKIDNNETLDNIDLESDELKEVKIELNVSAYISDNYINDIAQKVLTYQKISNITTNEEALDVTEELIDRFGDIPEETQNLIKVVKIRNLARKLNITRIVQKQNYIIFEPSNLKYQLTNNVNNDILSFVQSALHELQKMLLIEKGN